MNPYTEGRDQPEQTPLSEHTLALFQAEEDIDDPRVLVDIACACMADVRQLLQFHRPVPERLLSDAHELLTRALERMPMVEARVPVPSGPRDRHYIVADWELPHE